LDANFSHLITIRSIRINTDCRGMQDIDGDYSYEDEIRGMDVHMGIEGTN
jgi:hypothetical protein